MTLSGTNTGGLCTTSINPMPTPNTKLTPLYAAHQSSGAVFTDFVGWSMPLRYGSHTQEHLAVRNKAGMFDVSHMLAVDITGPDARFFARRVFSNDIDHITLPGGALYGCLLNHQGGVIDDTIWWMWSETELLVVLNAGGRDTDLAWLNQQAAGLDIAITPRLEHGILAVQGPEARALCRLALPDFDTDGLDPMQARQLGDIVISRSGYTGEDGLELILPAHRLTTVWEALLNAGVVPCGLAARDSLRLEAGMRLYGNDLSESISPLEAGIGWCVNFSDPHRDFIGRQALEQQKSDATHRRCVGLLLPKGVLRAGYPLFTEQEVAIGTVTSGGFSPCMKCAIGFGLVDTKIAKGTTLQVEIRSKLFPVQVVASVFVRKGAIQVPIPQN